MDKAELTAFTSELAGAYLANNTVPVAEIPTVIKAIFSALSALGAPEPVLTVVPKQEPAVPVKKSVTPDFIICLEDGKKLKMLKRHLSSSYSMTPDEYRAKWGLPSDYPMVAPNYARHRSSLAKKIGLGTKARIER